MPCVRSSAEALPRQGEKRQFRKRRDPMISGLPADRDMGEAKSAGVNVGKKLVPAFNFLQTQDVRIIGVDEAPEESKTETDGVDIPGDNSQFHGSRVAAKKAPNSGEGWALCVLHAMRREGSRR